MTTAEKQEGFAGALTQVLELLMGRKHYSPDSVASDLASWIFTDDDEPATVEASAPEGWIKAEGYWWKKWKRAREINQISVGGATWRVYNDGDIQCDITYLFDDIASPYAAMRLIDQFERDMKDLEVKK